MPVPERPGWGVVVPVKPLEVAKSRLAPLGQALRRELALAFAEDVVTAVRACPAVARVLVVTDDPRVRQVLSAAGAQVVADVGSGLDAALEHGARTLETGAPDARPAGALCGVAAVPADLPALRPEHLSAVLARVPPAARVLVADADDLGTTLLAAPAGTALAPAYGPGSRARHRAGGAVELSAAQGLRRDVDTPGDLERALALGVGARTAAVAARLSRRP